MCEKFVYVKKNMDDEQTKCFRYENNNRINMPCDDVIEAFSKAGLKKPTW